MRLSQKEGKSPHLFPLLSTRHGEQPCAISKEKRHKIYPWRSCKPSGLVLCRYVSSVTDAVASSKLTSGELVFFSALGGLKIMFSFLGLGMTDSSTHRVHVEPNPICALQWHLQPYILFWLIDKTQPGLREANVGKRSSGAELGTEFKSWKYPKRKVIPPQKPLSHNPLMTEGHRQCHISSGTLQHNMEEAQTRPFRKVSLQMRLFCNLIRTPAVYSHNCFTIHPMLQTRFYAWTVHARICNSHLPVTIALSIDPLPWPPHWGAPIHRSHRESHRLGNLVPGIWAAPALNRLAPSY